jgi:hypothetical protein
VISDIGLQIYKLATDNLANAIWPCNRIKSIEADFLLQSFQIDAVIEVFHNKVIVASFF